MAVNDCGKFYYAYSCDLDINVQIKIGTLEGKFPRPKHSELLSDPMLYYSDNFKDGLSDLYVTCEVMTKQQSLCLPTQTSYKSFTSRWNWNEWLELPIKYSELARDCLLTLTIHHIHHSHQHLIIGGTSISLFSKTGVYRQGMYDLRVWGRVQGGMHTPGKAKSNNDEMSRIYKLSKNHKNGRMMKVDWMDRLTFREVEMINERQKRCSEQVYLMVEFPCMHFNNCPTNVTLLYYEKDADNVTYNPRKGTITTLYDPDLEEENLVEDKHYRLARSVRAGLLEKELKPNAAVRDRLMTLISYPATKTLTPEDKDLIWRFRFYLSTHKKALVKFLRSVQWKVPAEVAQALHLLPLWSAMGSGDALELLTPSFTHPSVRRYAVARLGEADDEDLLLYLLQLVQALKYENFNQPPKPPSLSPHPSIDESDARFKSLGLTEESEDERKEPRKTCTHSSLCSSLQEASVSVKECSEEEMDLSAFLISRACRNVKLANYLYWYLRVESGDDDDTSNTTNNYSPMYKAVLQKFCEALNKGPRMWQQTRASFVAQEHFMAGIVAVVKAVARETGNRLKKITKLQHCLKEHDLVNHSLTSFDPLPLPLDPDIKVKGIEAESATLFKSALMPCKLTFKSSEEDRYVSIFKHGDDLRQDQLVLQIITLIDQLLKRENLDLKLTPYKVLATSSRHGFVQYIESTSVAEILSNDGCILNYFRKVAPSEHGPMGVQHEVIANYVKSCAGYCIITYLLGIGDRHFDNLLITKNGKLFHIDFGFILGREPKPMQPPMKLSREMVDAMGGVGGEWWAEFKQLCYTAFLHLRRSSNLILNLFSLMLDANVPDIALEPDKTVKKVQDRFQLGLTDEEAVGCIQNMIDISVSATAAAFIEHMHKFTQYLRK